VSPRKSRKKSACFSAPPRERRRAPAEIQASSRRGRRRLCSTAWRSLRWPSLLGSARHGTPVLNDRKTRKSGFALGARRTSFLRVAQRSPREPRDGGSGRFWSVLDERAVPEVGQRLADFRPRQAIGSRKGRPETGRKRTASSPVWTTTSSPVPEKRPSRSIPCD